MDMMNSNINTSLLNIKNNSLQNNVKNLDKNTKQPELKSVCDDFEAFFMQQILDLSLKNSTIAGEDTGSEIIKGMYTENLSKQSAGGLGISDMLYTFLSENKKAK
jgi:Rod binding domain-containing protein